MPTKRSTIRLRSLVNPACGMAPPVYTTCARFFDPDTGRFTQQDPLDLGGGDINLYRYAANTPTNLTDPTGLFRDYATQAFLRPIPPWWKHPATLSPLQRAAVGLAVVYTIGDSLKDDPGNVSDPNYVYKPNSTEEWNFAWGWFKTTSASSLAGATAIAAGKVAGTAAAAATATATAAIALAPAAAATGYYIGKIARDNNFLGVNDKTQGALLWLNDKLGGYILWTDAPVKPGPKGAGRPAKSKDPNEKTSLDGFGDSSFISADTTITYRVDFENDPSATAPAQIVTISDPLAAELDPSTFELTEIGFGDVLIAVPDNTQQYETVVSITASSGKEIDVEIEAGMDPDSGEIFVRFVTIDPDTGLPPDVLTGFLPPEDDTGRGQGFFSFVIDHVGGLPSGTEIRNVADIVFDFSATIATNQVDPLDPSQGTDPNKEALVTIDAGTPTSSVTELPAAAVTNDFIVDWSGQDDVGGSGVASYDIFVSENGGSFEPWLLGTTETSGEFTGGVIGTTYGFLSMARDNVGHVEPMPTTADTETIVGPWVNPLDVFDVNAKDGVTALDALLIINELGRNSVSDPITGVLTPLPPGGFAPPYYDVAFDGKISALDALRVINQIARLTSGSGETSGENVDALALPVPQQLDSAWQWSLGVAKPTFFTDVSDSESRSPQAKLTGFDAFQSPSTNLATVPHPNTAARSFVNAISDELESTLRMLADDVAQQWAVG